MASYTVAIGDKGVHAKVLAANVVDTVSWPVGATGTPGWMKTPKAVEVLTDGLADVYFTTDGSTPTVAGGNCYRVPVGSTSSLIAPVDDTDPTDGAQVKLISTGAATYSVTRAG